jgi:HTH-type transcriptional regulator/antitoxin HigA
MNTSPPYQEGIKAISHVAPFLSHIQFEKEYQDAMAMIDKLIDDFDNNIALIEHLTDTIKEWENTSKAFTGFNVGVPPQDAVDMPRFLMNKHDFGVANLPAISVKSLFSKILKRKGRDRNRRYIEVLSKRLRISPTFFPLTF